MADTLVQDPPSAPPSTPDASQTPPPAADATPPTKPPTDAQMERYKKHAKNVLGISFEDDPPADAPKKEEKPAEIPPADEPPKPPAKPVAAKKTPPRVVPPQPERDRAEENKELATSVAKAVASELKPKSEAPPTVDISAEDKRKIEVLEHMGKLFPEHKDTANAYRRAITAQEEYEARWQSAHPDETFDPDGDEHKAFYQRNWVDIPDDLETEARIDLAAEKKLKPMQEKLAAAERERARADKLRDSEQVIQRDQAEAAKMVADQFEDGPASLDAAAMAKYAEENPLEAQVYGHAINSTAHIARISHQLFNGLVDYDKANAAHVEVQRAANDLETSLLALPPESRLDDDGKLFLAYNDFHSLPEAKRAKYWTVDSKSLNQFVAGKNAEHAKIQLKNQREWIAKVTKQPIHTNGSKPNGTPPAVAKVDPKPLVPKVRVESPGATSEPLVPRGQGAPTKARGSAIERYQADMLG